MTVTTGTNRAFVRSAARLFEFDQTGKYVREIGPGTLWIYSAHAVRVDPQDNIWVMDEGSNMMMKFDPEGRVAMNLGSKPEAIKTSGAAAGSQPGGRGGAAARGASSRSRSSGRQFRRSIDVAWDAAGNIFIADGYGSRG